MNSREAKSLHAKGSAPYTRFVTLTLICIICRKYGGLVLFTIERLERKVMLC
jgi:hypothetical protein